MASNAQKIRLIVYINFLILACATVYIIFKMTRLVIIHQEIANSSPEKQPGFLPPSIRERVIYGIVEWVIIVASTTTINVVLLKGLIQRSHTKCLIWLILAGVGTVYQINRVIQSFLVQEYFEGLYLLGWTLISVYGMYVVKSFMNEIKTDSTLQPLTSKP